MATSLKNKAKAPRVFLVTAVHNNWGYTKKFLANANSQDYKNIEIIVVDDGSTDDTDKNIRKFYPNVTVLYGDGNLWWTGSLYMACEYIAKHGSPSDYFITINNDCTFPEGFVSGIVKDIRTMDRTIMGSIAVSANDKKTIIDAGAKLDWKRARVQKAGFRFIDDIPKDYKYDFNLDTLSTRGTIYPVSIIKKIGNFDKKHLPHYVSDFEYACRAKKKGYKLVVDYSCRYFNDDKRTGTSGPEDKPINMPELRKMLFDRKSQINIVDHFYFIYLCCPWYLQPLNYIYLLAKLLYLTSYLKPFYPFRKPIVKLRSLLLFDVK